MATYNKRGYKSPKPEVEKDPAFDTSVDEINVNENESTTAGVFNALDETANKTEEWVIRNQKAILGFIFFTLNLQQYSCRQTGNNTH